MRRFIVAGAVAALLMAIFLVWPRPRPVGTLIATRTGADVSVCDLRDTGKTRAVSRLGLPLRASAGVSEMLDGEVFFSSDTMIGTRWEPRVFGVNPFTGRVRALGSGVNPALCREERCLVFYSAHTDTDSVIALVRSSTQRAEVRDTLGFMHRLWGREHGWWFGLNAPVVMESSWVATIGPDGAVWKVHARTGQWVALGQRGLIPAFWQASERVLVCRGAAQLGKFVALSADGREKRALPLLDGMAAYGPSRTGPWTLVVLPGWSIWIAEVWTLKRYDWRRDRLETVSVGWDCFGRIEWVE